MQGAAFDVARTALCTARRSARAVDRWPAHEHPRTLAEAYALQTAVAAELGAIRGWKIAGVTAQQRSALGVDRPVAAPLLAPWLHDARDGAATLRVADFIKPKLECEFAFELARDLPARDGGDYARGEVEDAIAAMRIGFEVVDSRLPAGSGALAEIADAFNNGAYVAGPSFADWRELDFATLGIVLTVVADAPAAELARGSGAAILDGDPFATVVMLANAPPDRDRGLRAGDIVTTGSCTGAPFLPGPGLYRAEFAGLAGFDVRFIA